jgi:hypothetical protein
MKLVQPSANLYFEQYKENPNKIQKGVAIIK